VAANGAGDVAEQSHPVEVQVDKKIASRETIRVSLGHGSFSSKTIQTAKIATWMQTKARRSCRQDE
jgi:hypothetical protein